MQLQLNINDIKANIFLELLEVFKKDNLVEDYKIVNKYNEYENEIVNDLQNLHLSMKDDGYKTDKFIEIDNLKWNFKLLKKYFIKNHLENFQNIIKIYIMIIMFPSTSTLKYSHLELDEQISFLIYLL